MADGTGTSTAGLIEKLDAAIRPEDIVATTERLKSLLAEMAAAGAIHLPERFYRPASDCYARRFLHRCEKRGYTAVVMTWGPGQSTPLHDHAGMWCVEGVIDGEIDVTRYDLQEQRDGRCRFERIEKIRAGVGTSGSLIPPYEYHVIANALPQKPSVTLHVYGGEMNHCCIYEPLEGDWYSRAERKLSYYED
jgi:predicted metal-dependent enzyme (double-stranded beta helix superfamily)